MSMHTLLHQSVEQTVAQDDSARVCGERRRYAVARPGLDRGEERRGSGVGLGIHLHAMQARAGRRRLAWEGSNKRASRDDPQLSEDVVETAV